MNSLILKSINYRNFKCLKSFNFEPNATITKVFGPNGSGKTTMFDGFKWLLFDKNSNDSKAFSIKPLDAFGKDIPNLEIEVAANILFNGVVIKLQKIQKENWVKKRGESEKTFQGNVSEYYIDDVPMAKKDFEKKIDDIISEDAFKMITSLDYFPKMHWTKQREMLFVIAGEVTDEFVEASNPDLAGFADMLNGKSYDDFKKMISKQVSNVKDELKKIPIRIDEVDRAKLELPEFEKVDIEATVADLKEQVRITDQSLSDINVANAEADKIVSKINTLKMSLGTIERVEINKLQSGYLANRNNLTESNNDISNKERILNNHNKDIESIQEQILTLEKQKSLLTDKWHVCDKKEFVEPDRTAGNFNCNCCGQALPSDKVDETINSMKVKFANDKSIEKKQIETDGFAKKTRIEALKNDITLIESKINTITEEITTEKVNRDHLEKLLSHPIPEKTDFTDVVEWVNVQNEIKALNASIQDKGDSSALLAFRNEKSENIKELEKFLTIYESVDKSELRKQEIQASESVLSAELLDLEKKQFKCEEFIRTKVDITDGKINNKFKNVRFKLFNEQVNGGIAETCEALVNTNGSWVPYSDANTAGQKNAGLDILNALSEHYQITAPVFVDHSEAVTQLIDSNSQIICLYVADIDALTYE